MIAWTEDIIIGVNLARQLGSGPSSNFAARLVMPIGPSSTLVN